MEKTEQIPLCVDLDGTIISTDTLFESIVLAIKSKPWIVIFIPFWLLKSKAHLKRKVADVAMPAPDLLPYREEVADYLRAEAATGRPLVLITGADERIAESVGKHLGFFEQYFGTNGYVNLVSEHKTRMLVKLYGERGFDYLGDCLKDVEIWKKARRAILVQPRRGVRSAAAKVCEVEKVFRWPKRTFKNIIDQIRVYQWVKNILVFFPFLMALPQLEVNGPGTFGGILAAFYGFVSFSFTASFVYVLNDLTDIESDRMHPRKRHRPLASGKLSVAQAFAAGSLLLASGFVIAAVFLPPEFLLVLATYFVVTTAYSFFLKKMVILDIITLACLYTLRLIAGATASEVTASHWLLAFSIFIFLSLACVKRYSELRVMLNRNKQRPVGRGYSVKDIDMVMTVGVVAGYLSALVLSLYIHDVSGFAGIERIEDFATAGSSAAIFKRPQFMWPIALLLLYWITRIWFLAHRDEMHDDPIIFTVRDPISYAVGILTAALAVGAVI